LMLSLSEAVAAGHANSRLPLPGQERIGVNRPIGASATGIVGQLLVACVRTGVGRRSVVSCLALLRVVDPFCSSPDIERVAGKMQ